MGVATMARGGTDFLQLHRRDAPRHGLTAWLTGEVRTAVAEGRLAPGSPLPPTRTLALDLGVSRGVVVEAYRRLVDEGVVESRVGAGTLVAGHAVPQDTVRNAAPSPAAPDTGTTGPLLPARTPAGVDVDLSPGVPDLSAFPRAAWLRAERTVLATAGAADLGYGDPRGSARLRTELATWLARTRGLRASAEQIVVVAGVAQSLALLAQVLRARGDTTTAMEDPCSRGARDALTHWGLDILPVPVDEGGVRIEELAATPARTVVLTPAHQFPTGVVLAPDRRRELLTWVRRVDGLVVEDDYDAEHRYDRAPVPALHASAPGHVAHTGSTSKTLAPGMRIGWLVPPPALLAEVVAAKHANDLGSPVLPQLVLAELLTSGAYDRHLRAVRARQRARRDAVVAAVREHLPTGRIGGAAAGLHLLVTLPDDGREDTELASRARDAGVLVHPLSWHRRLPGPPGLVLGYAAHTPDRLTDAVRRLGRVVGPSGR